jgi:hypothetical protein
VILRDQHRENDHLFGPDRLPKDLLHLDHQLVLVVAEILLLPRHHLQCLQAALLCRYLLTIDQITHQSLLLLGLVHSSHHLEAGTLVEVVEDHLVMTARPAQILLLGEQHLIDQPLIFRQDRQEALNPPTVLHLFLPQSQLVHPHLPFQQVLQVGYLQVRELV